jgi:hypothetical protein
LSDDFQVVGNDIEVRARSGGFRRIPTPVGYTPLAFRNAIAGIQTWFLAKGSLPTVDDLYSLWPKIDKATYAGLMMTPELKVALEYRGVPWEIDSGLSIEQQTALLKLADPTDRRSLPTRLKELGISQPKYQSWLKQPLFRAMLNQRTKDLYADYLPEVRGALVGKAVGGDIQAIDRVLAITGEWDPAAREVQNAREVVLKVMDAVVKRVEDKDVRQAILADVQAAVVGFDVMNALESSKL